MVLPRLLYALVVSAVFLGGVATARGEFREGVEAYQRGDELTALAEFWPLADQGHLAAQFNVGVLYAQARVIPRDLPRAAEWYRRAAKQGHALAQCNLGGLYEQGEGVPQSYGEALFWYQRSAEQGNPGGQNNLGRMYEYGLGVSRDDSQAFRWYRLAAEQGNPPAQANLARLYFEGKGVQQDDVLAHVWSALSAAQGSQLAARIHDALIGRMSPDHLRLAERLAREWSPGSNQPR